MMRKIIFAESQGKNFDLKFWSHTNKSFIHPPFYLHHQDLWGESHFQNAFAFTTCQV